MKLGLLPERPLVGNCVTVLGVSSDWSIYLDCCRWWACLRAMFSVIFSTAAAYLSSSVWVVRQSDAFPARLVNWTRT